MLPRKNPRTDAPVLTQNGLLPTQPAIAIDEAGQQRETHIAHEHPLTIYLDRQEIVTLMTMGTEPELLVLGWLKNQHLLPSLDLVKSIQVDWETNAAAITTYAGNANLGEKISKKTVTTGCGQGTVFGDLMANIEQIKLPALKLSQSTVYGLLKNLSQYNEVYKTAGGVHGCALCQGVEILAFVEDVGRHNAVDALAGYQWLHDIPSDELIFYTTGRLTSEMVIKVAQMGISVLLSRSGITQMGLNIAQKLGVLMIARAKGKHYLIYNGQERFRLE